MEDVEEAFNTAITNCGEQFNHAPKGAAYAPGRVNLIGGHVDYNDGVVLPVAINRGTIAAVAPRDDETIRAYSSAFDAKIEEAIGGSMDGWGAYVLGTANVLSEVVEEPLGANIYLSGDMIIGAGLSSSASLEVAVAGGLNQAYGLELDPETIADSCWRAENEEVGMSCGIMDQFSSALGRAGKALRIDCRDRSIKYLPFDSEAVKLMVIDTTVTHNLTNSGFNDRVRECHEATAELDAVMGKRVRSLRDVSPEEVAAHADALSPILYRRATHVTSEIRRVEAAAEALEGNHIDTVGSLMRESHRSLKEHYEVSCSELNTVVDLLDDQAGVYGSRMVGGGWGGSVAALIEPSAVATVTESVAEGYHDITGIECNIHVLSVGDGLRTTTT